MPHHCFRYRVAHRHIDRCQSCRTAKERFQNIQEIGSGRFEPAFARIDKVRMNVWLRYWHWDESKASDESVRQTLQTRFISVVHGPYETPPAGHSYDLKCWIVRCVLHRQADSFALRGPA